MASRHGTNVASPITTFTDQDKYATAYADEINGGLHTVATVDERNAIPVLRRKLGMHCQVVGGDEYILINNPTTDATKNSDWKVNIPNTDDIKMADGKTTIETAIGDATTLASAKYAVFEIVHDDVTKGIVTAELTIPFNGNIKNITASVKSDTTLTADAVFQVEMYNGTVWSVVGVATVPVASTKKAVTVAVNPVLPIAIGNRLRVNITAVQDGVACANVVVEITSNAA